MKKFIWKYSLIVLSLLMTPCAVMAEWVLDPAASEVTYLSSKMVRDNYKTIFEKNRFTQIKGHFNHDEAVLKINTASIETNVPIRNERIMKYIFQTERYPYAEVRLSPGEDLLKQVKPGAFYRKEVKGTLTIRGVSKPVLAKVSIVRTGHRLLVQSVEPILVDTLAYGLGDGFGTLKKLAKLFNIPTTIPVNFSLIFIQQ